MRVSPRTIRLLFIALLIVIALWIAVPEVQSGGNYAALHMTDTRSLQVILTAI